MHAKNHLSIPFPMSLPAKPISSAEIVGITKKLHVKKVPGHDLVTTKKSILLNTHIYNFMLCLSFFPKS